MPFTLSSPPPISRRDRLNAGTPRTDRRTRSGRGRVAETRAREHAARCGARNPLLGSRRDAPHHAPLWTPRTCAPAALDMSALPPFYARVGCTRTRAAARETIGSRSRWRVASASRAVGQAMGEGLRSRHRPVPRPRARGGEEAGGILGARRAGDEAEDPRARRGAARRRATRLPLHRRRRACREARSRRGDARSRGRQGARKADREGSAAAAPGRCGRRSRRWRDRSSTSS